MYTGVRNVRRRNGRIESSQTQCIAIGDGVDYEKLDTNPVIDAAGAGWGLEFTFRRWYTHTEIC